MKKCLLVTALLIHFISRSQTPEPVFVYFATDKYELSRAARATLDSLTDSLDLADHIEIHGHCDNRGSDAYNLRLSEQRVRAVEKYLLANGWERKDITIEKAHGEKQPLDDNNTDKGRGLNRRVEIRILRGAAKSSLTEQVGSEKIKAGDNIVLPDIYFRGGMHQFLPVSGPALQDLLSAMRRYPKLVIEVEGHICCHPDKADGLDLETGLSNLSEARAIAVMNFLISNGIEPERVSYKGYGHSRPVYPYPETTEAQMTANRRVEIRIIKK